jgi:hypothetical protein
MHRKILEFRYFIKQLAGCFLAVQGITAQTVEHDANSSGELNRDGLNHITTALGASWFSNGDGEWHLVKPNNLETHIAVAEFLEYFGMKRFRFMGHEPVEESVFIIELLSPAVDIGLPIIMKYFESARDSE